MEKLENFIGPGTAGVAQRIPSEREYYLNNQEMQKIYKLSVLEYNKITPCEHNQY